MNLGTVGLSRSAAFAAASTLLNPSVLKFLLLAGHPIRFAIGANIFIGRSIRSVLQELLHRFLELVGWLAGRVGERSVLHRWERRFLPFKLHRWHVALGALSSAMLLKWGHVVWREHRSGKAMARKALHISLHSAITYDEWCKAALSLEELDYSKSKMKLAAEYYDERLVSARTTHLAVIRGTGDVYDLMHALRSDLVRNFGGITNPDLHDILPVVPSPIREYIKEVQACLRCISTASNLPLEEKLNFLRETRHAFGRTALVLSGGGSFGAFHIGVVSAILNSKMLPRVISGSSAGAIVAAIVCTRSDEELALQIAAIDEVHPEDFYAPTAQLAFYSANSAAEVLRHLIRKGTLQDSAVLQEKLQGLLGEVTFFEAFQRSGRILNISVTAADTKEPPRLLNYLTAPNVIIWSAVVCSSAFPFLYSPGQLLARNAKGHIVSFSSAGTADCCLRRWRDGSLEEDLPMRGLSEMFGVNQFLVSQANPYLLPILALKRAVPRLLGNLAEEEFKHRCKQLMELVPSWLGASRVLKLLNQPWEGDVTMVFPANSVSLGKALINLTKDDFIRALKEGTRSAWRRLSAIQSNCAVEVTIDDCLHQVAAEARLHNRARLNHNGRQIIPQAAASMHLRRSLPSWIHMPTILHPEMMMLGRPESLNTLGFNSIKSIESMVEEGVSPLHRHARHSSFGDGDAEPGMAHPVEPSLLEEPELETLETVLSLADGLMDDEIGLLQETPPPQGGAAKGEGDATTAPSPGFHKGANAWRDFFSLAPATNERKSIVASPSRGGLDVFAY